MPSENEISKQVGSIVLDYMKNTPSTVAVLFLSYMSGKLWLFIIQQTVKSQKGVAALSKWYATTALGLLWYSVIASGYYLIAHGNLNIKYENLLSMIVPILILGLLIQAPLFALFIYVSRRR